MASARLARIDERARILMWRALLVDAELNQNHRSSASQCKIESSVNSYLGWWTLIVCMPRGRPHWKAVFHGARGCGDVLDYFLSPALPGFELVVLAGFGFRCYWQRINRWKDSLVV